MTATAPNSPVVIPFVPLQPFDRDTLTRIFFGAVDRFGPQEALRYKRDGRWQIITGMCAAQER